MAQKRVFELSAISKTTTADDACSYADALPREVMHDLQYRHKWKDIQLHLLSSSDMTTVTKLKASALSAVTEKIYLVSGMPPRHTYVHPDFLNHLIKNNLEEIDVDVQREWVLPMNTGEKWSLRRFCNIFDALPKRDVLEGAPGCNHQDAKRVLCGMKAHDGFGGDGTIVYYIMQEGEIKPRQN